MLIWLIGGGIALLLLWLHFTREPSSSASAEFDQRVSSGTSEERSEGVPDRRLAADQRFRSRETLMSPAEASLFGNLRLIFGEGYTVFSKVRMADVLEPVQTGKEGKSAFNEISQKHLDYVICREGTWEIVCAVELDDSSHRRNAAVVRDTFVNIIFSGAGVPLVRVPARAAYSVQELRKRFGSILQPAPSDNNQEAERYMPTAA